MVYLKAVMKEVEMALLSVVEMASLMVAETDF